MSDAQPTCKHGRTKAHVVPVWHLPDDTCPGPLIPAPSGSDNDRICPAHKGGYDECRCPS